MDKLGKLLAGLVAVALLGTGCGGAGDDQAGGASTTEAQGSATTEADSSEAQGATVVGDDYVFSEAPAELPAGAVDLTFENRGQVEHELALVEIGDTPLDQVIADIGPTIEGGPFPDYVQNLAVPVVADAGETEQTTAVLAEGNYALICTFTGVAPEEGATTTSVVEGIGGAE
ncbi:MAG TPA: hypothetical protein VK988_10285, partial [Acidimicrobiales bacterium]|nr:hypothetical protein [Acidimicrobiales bacterium]